MKNMPSRPPRLVELEHPKQGLPRCANSRERDPKDGVPLSGSDSTIHPGFPIPYGYCQCGCGRKTSIAQQSTASRGHSRGEPIPFVSGHSLCRPVGISAGGNDSGLCRCGCGQPTPIAKSTARKYGHVRGKHVWYCMGHQARKSPVQYIPDAATGCWVWQGSVNREGYGSVRRGPKSGKAHRLFYETANGPLAKGLVVHHKCGNKRCVNPEHLVALTPSAHSELHGPPVGKTGA